MLDTGILLRACFAPFSLPSYERKMGTSAYLWLCYKLWVGYVFLAQHEIMSYDLSSIYSAVAAVPTQSFILVHL